MGGFELDRRSLLIASPLLLAAVAGGDHPGAGDLRLAPAPETGPDPGETFVLPYDGINFESWGNLPPHSGEMAKLYGDFDKPGPYLVMMKWNPGWFSAPHTYATDRIQVVVKGTWFVNSGSDFQPQDAVPVGAGGYVLRTAGSPHYDGVPANHPDPAVIAVFGNGPVDMALVDPTQPSWRRV
ncbi:MAG: tat pathway signal sequence [Mycobacterium sp.]